MDHDTYLSLEFESFEQWVTTTAHLDVVASSARSTDHSLLISIKLAQASFSPWSSSTSSSSSSSSSSSTHRAAGPASEWVRLEAAIASIYSAATRQLIDSDRILTNVDVVLDTLRTIPTCRPARVVHSFEWTSTSLPRPPPRQLATSSSTTRTRQSYTVVALGGTFDHLHMGHKILLTMACSIATDKVIVGVSDQPLLVNKQYPRELEPVTDRIHNVERFLQLVRPTVRHQVVPLQDVYGPTATDPDIEAIVVSEETRSGGDMINKLRSERSLSTLDTFVINLVSDDASAADTTTTSSGEFDGESGSSSDAKVTVETKMGSTAIRKWISERR
ncbi:hypothetical protein JCM3766R1_002484 [Sporobolomyces carnicolor]